MDNNALGPQAIVPAIKKLCLEQMELSREGDIENLFRRAGNIVTLVVGGLAPTEKALIPVGFFLGNYAAAMAKILGKSEEEGLEWAAQSTAILLELQSRLEATHGQD